MILSIQEKLDTEGERNLSDVDGGSVAHNEDEDEESMDLANEDFINNLGPPGKRRKVEMNEERSRHGIWNRRFKTHSGRLIYNSLKLK